MIAMAAKNVFISEREVSYLGRKFIIYLALAHRQSRPNLRNLTARKGGYILHVDGTCEGDSPNLYCGLVDNAHGAFAQFGFNDEFAQFCRIVTHIAFPNR